MSSSVPPLWQRIDHRALLSTRVFDIQAIRFDHPQRTDGGKEFFVIDAPDWVIAAPVTPAGELVMVRQFRFGVEQLSWELPGGVSEPDETPTQTAVRELMEETGYRGGEPEVLGWVHPNPAIQNNRAHLVAIPDARLVAETNWDQDEEIEMALVPIPEALRRARSGEVTHALMLNMLFLLEPWWQRHAGQKRGV
jgi:ADP-ribose pyrophosphatase